MGNMNIIWDEIGISNDFLFGRIMRNPELCKELLQRILPERSRYYQGMIDLQLIDKGQYYKELSRSYVIFICPFDVFGKGRHIYTFENICKEDHTLLLGDGTTKIFLNADSEMNDVSGELKAFLDYVVGKKSNDSFVNFNKSFGHTSLLMLYFSKNRIKKLSYF